MFETEAFEKYVSGKTVISIAAICGSTCIYHDFESILKNSFETEDPSMMLMINQTCSAENVGVANGMILVLCSGYVRETITFNSILQVWLSKWWGVWDIWLYGVYSSSFWLVCRWTWRYLNWFGLPSPSFGATFTIFLETHTNSCAGIIFPHCWFSKTPLPWMIWSTWKCPSIWECWTNCPSRPPSASVITGAHWQPTCTVGLDRCWSCSRLSICSIWPSMDRTAVLWNISFWASGSYHTLSGLNKFYWFWLFP